MRKQLYQNMLLRLKSLADENNEAVFTTVGLWADGAAATLQAADMPAVLMECGETEWKTLGGGSQEALHTLKLHILTAPGSNATGETATAEILQAFDLSARVYSSLLAMQNESGCCRTLRRAASAATFTAGGCMDNTDTYRMLAVERSWGES